MSALADLTDAGLADEGEKICDEISRRNGLLLNDARPSARSLVMCRRGACAKISDGLAQLRAGPSTPLPATDLPAIDEPRVPRRPPLGGDPTRPLDGNRLPPGRYHP